MNSYCTIVDENYLPFAYALYDSIKSVNEEEFQFYIFVSNRYTKDKSHMSLKANVNYIFIDEICVEGTGKDLYDNYFVQQVNSFRWSMKPVLVNYILDKYNAPKVICTDCDIRFFRSTKFLFNLLDENNVILSPHFRSSDPVNNYENFILQYNSGIFNGGFVAANSSGKSAMQWWAKTCLAICEFDPCKGQYFDQVHFNLMPVYFEKVHILQHRGCNLANWNLQECKRVLQSNNEVLIDNQYPVIFIHFTKSTMLGILRGEDKHLLGFFEAYSENVKRYNPDMDLMGAHSKIIQEEKVMRERRLAEAKKKPTLQKRIVLKLKSLFK